MVTKREESQSIPLVQELVQETGIKVRSIHAPFLLAAKKVWGGPQEKIAVSIDMAHALHADVVVIHLPYFWQWGYARWARHHLNDYSRRSDVIVAMENAMHVYLYRPFNLSLFNSLQDIRCFDNLVFDTSHFAIAGVNIFRAWEELRGHVRHIHLSNNYLKGFDDHALPFEGRLPLDRFLQMLHADGFEGKIALELGPGPLEARLGRERIVYNLRRSLAYCLDNYA
ncbi:MAG: sugar phosphate isomerase/epimerase [Actinobacteria bacterium]|jgi:sugar phosphate isomerase/epimerase|nr:MAG: sugar phosphate isomerase/epimerase [Actinomycetota bacterium]